MSRFFTLTAAVFLSIGFFCAAPAESLADEFEEAFELNRDAMVDMSMAEFESAAEKFIRAADLVPDYGIKGRKLQYTPNFMAAWAFEKIGKSHDACLYFKKFLDIAPLGDREKTKAEHAEEYLSSHCGM